MSRPTTCAYCKGTGMADNDNECGFCDAGEPLETQEDWDRTWGRVLTECSDPLSRLVRLSEAFGLYDNEAVWSHIPRREDAS